jgi:hypothetical protein
MLPRMPFTQVIISIICPKHGPWHMIAVDPLLPLLLPPLPPLLLLPPPLPLPLLPPPPLLLLLLPPLPLLLPPLPLPLAPLPLTLMPIAWRHPFITCHATFSFFSRVSICIFLFQMYIYLVDSNTCAKRQRKAVRKGSFSAL